MKQRVVTGVVLALVMIPLFIIGKLPLNILLMLLSAGATYELFNLYNKENKLPSSIMVIEVILGMVLYFTIQSYFEGVITIHWIFMMIMFVLVVGAILSVFCPTFDADKFSQLLLNTFYPAFGFGAIFGLRSFGLYDLGFLFMITVMTDVFAYAVGVRIGKHRLAVHISPKKSIEGSVGGTLVATILTMGYIYVFKMETIGSIQLSFFISIALVVFISIMGQIGDLVASKLKRTYDVKDYSNIFPGHGGIMDRFDSVLFAAMVLMLLNEFVGILS
jgi:phosphatidate cytidylyltransferase